MLLSFPPTPGRPPLLEPLAQYSASVRRNGQLVVIETKHRRGMILVDSLRCPGRIVWTDDHVKDS